MSHSVDVSTTGRTLVRFDGDGLTAVLRAAADWIEAHAAEPYSDYLGNGLYVESITVTEYDGTHTVKLLVNDERSPLEHDPLAEPRP